MHDLIYSYTEKYSNVGAIVDANLFVLMIVGELRPDIIGNQRRVKEYTINDFYLLRDILSGFKKLVATPNVLTEVSNLIGEGNSEIIENVNLLFKRYVIEISEFFKASADAANDEYFQALGLADTTLKLLAQERYLLITVDHKLANIVDSCGYDVINFNHFRQP